MRCFHIDAVINNNHITCKSAASKTNELSLLIDTGSQVNILKINCLSGELKVNETQKIKLRGIHKEPIQTIGKIKIPIELNNNIIDTEFNIVGTQFPIPRDGILGHESLLKNKAIV